MSRRLFLPLLLLLACRPAVAADFFVTGDAPYGYGDLGRLAKLLEHAGGTGFIAHIGDIKSGNSRCSESTYAPVLRLFARQPLPVVFTPGDNDWTDCRRAGAGGHDPAERLNWLRGLLFSQPDVLRLAQLQVHRPTELPELFWFRRDGVLYINWHVVGSYNNRYPRDRAAMAEYRVRRAANHALLLDALANLGDSRAVVLFQHANPGMRRTKPHPGYHGMLADLRHLIENTRVPVLLVHGDTHSFQFNQPWTDRPGGERLWRLEVPGYPKVAGVRVTVSDDPAAPFSIAYRTPEQDEYE